MTFYFIVLSIPLAYFYFLTMGAFLSRFRRRQRLSVLSAHRFAIVVAAHNEELVIADTVKRLRELEYPTDRFGIHVVGDYCTDATVRLAQAAGAISHDRQSGPRTGKGAALSWLFERILGDERYDAVVVFDADTRVEPSFLRAMDFHLCNGVAIIQGQHRISNPQSGWFAALTEAKFLIDNQIQNLGRTYWGLCAKNMGDSVCLRRDILQAVGWGQGLTEDYQLRQKLLLAGQTITYAPEAVGWGEAPTSWGQAKTQRLRWMQGANEVHVGYRAALLKNGIATGNASVLDAAIESYLPTFSTLAALGVLGALVQSLRYLLGGSVDGLPALLFFVGLLAYPVVGLCLASAPARSYLALLKGPYFIAWRAASSLALRLRPRKLEWIRTQHGKVGA